MCTPASTMTVEVDGMVMFWQISYGLPARVHVTVCPGAGIGGRLQVPAGAARRGLECAAVAVKAVNDAKSNTNAVLSISRFERCVNIAVFFIWFLFGYKGTRAQPFFRNAVHPLISSSLGDQTGWEKAIEWFHNVRFSLQSYPRPPRGINSSSRREPIPSTAKR